MVLERSGKEPGGGCPGWKGGHHFSYRGCNRPEGTLLAGPGRSQSLPARYPPEGPGVFPGPETRRLTSSGHK